MRKLKPENRRSKSEGNPNIEIRKGAARLNFSDFEFRISGFNPEGLS
jgi:hypothetical protein